MSVNNSRTTNKYAAKMRANNKQADQAAEIGMEATSRAYNKHAAEIGMEANSRVNKLHAAEILVECQLARQTTIRRKGW